MLLSELLKNQNLNSQLFAFFNVRNIKDDFSSFEIRSKYTVSKFLKINENYKDDLAIQINQQLSEYSELGFECKKFGSHSIKIENDMERVTLDDYFNRLYKNIIFLSRNLQNNEFETALLNAIFALNGSADFNRNLYAVDINREYIAQNFFSKYFKLILNLDSNFINLNFRELQPDFYQNNKKRHPQFRINLRYFYEKTINTLPNIYKQRILLKKLDKIKPLPQNQEQLKTMIERFSFYSNFILGKTAINIDDLRTKLEFDKQNEPSNTINRNTQIITMARYLLPDKCAACSKKYDINNRTFKTRNGNLYLEIHHNIAFAFNRQICDSIDNLVKLCPSCHRALSKNRASEEYQKELIENILAFSNEAKEFAKAISQKDNSDLIEYIYETLQ